MSHQTTPQSPGHHQIPGYQLLSLLGKGGMGRVYQARQLSLDRVVAIKVLASRHARDPEYVQRLHAEGKAAAKLNHPHIVGALDVGQAGDVHYFVMEYVQGRTVYDELMENVRYDEEDALAIVLAIARALEHAHRMGIIHRDVKPQNIMITQDGVAKLADMGLARAADEDGCDAEPGKPIGSPYYMSPEQILNKPDIDFRTDLYSLGASLYYMVTGRPPYDAPTAQQVMTLHLRQPFTPPRKHNPRLSDGLGQVIQVCLAKVREDRYDDTAHLVADLEAVIAGDLPLHAAGKLGLDAMLEDEGSVSADPPRHALSSSAAQATPTPGTIAPQDAMVSPVSTPPPPWGWITLAIVGWAVAAGLLAVLLWRS